MSVSLRHFIEPSRLDSVLTTLQRKMPDHSRDHLLRCMDAQFLELFLSKAFGDAMMVTAGYQYLKMLEQELQER